MRRIAKVLLVGLAALVLAGAGIFGWLWFQWHQVSELQRAGKYADAIRLTERNLSIFEKVLGSENVVVGDGLSILGELYRQQGRYAEAEPLFKRSLAIREKALGPEHPDVGSSLNSLALLYNDQGHYAEAEPLFKRSLAIFEKALGPEHPYVAAALNSLASLYQHQARLAEAEPLYKRSLAIFGKALGPEDPYVAAALNSLASLYQHQARFAEAEPLYKRSLPITEKALGPEHLEVGAVLNNLALLHSGQGRLAEAVPLLRRSLAITEKARGPEHPDVAAVLNNLAGLYHSQGRHAEAVPLLRRSLAITEKARGPEHPDVGIALNNLAELYRDQGRLAEAEQLFRRSLAVWEKALGPEHHDVGAALSNLAGLYKDQGRYEDAEPLFRRSLAITEKALGPGHPDVGLALNNLAELYRLQGRYADAEPLYRRSLAIAEKARGPEHADVARSLNNLAQLYRVQGRYADAEPLFRRSLAITEKALGPGHPELALSLNNVARLGFDQSDWARAADYWRRSTGVLKRRAERGLAGAADGSAKGEAQRSSWQFTGLVKATHRLAADGRGPASLAAEMFETAQWGQGSEAAAALAQMAARSAKDSPELTGLVRERQDLAGEWQAKDKLLIAAKSSEPANRKAEAEKVLADRLAAIDDRLAELNGRLAKDFPNYAALASPIPTPLSEVQAHLGPDEALVLFLDTPEWKPLPEESFVWVVTTTEVRWARSEFGTAALKREVAALRCGLDGSVWEGTAGKEHCADALGGPPLRYTPSSLPFDHARAHKLYMGLFGEVQDLIEGKHLLIVPSGPLTQLPFQVLVTQPPGTGDHRATAWLAREHAITVLPAVSSLKALRRVSRPSAAPRPMIGFGNPLLTGYAGRPGDEATAKAVAKDHAQWAKEARAKERCPETRPQRVAARVDHRSGVAGVETRGGIVNLADIKEQVPLPETADELCAVADRVNAEPRDIHLGTKATEREVKQLSASGELAKYRMVHFATHGTLAGELKGTHEPGLILTPPPTATEDDDGYLSASEIAALKLDADWVVLSACNTAAGGAVNAEALSGLGRAFIYAGARSLLVSHWAVYSEATVKLITGAVREMAGNAKVGRAEAMRLSMLALIDMGSQEEAHPAFWAPFVVVGEGGRGR